MAAIVVALLPLVVTSPLNSAAVIAVALPRIKPTRVEVVPVPPFATGNVPLTSAARATAAKDGAPAALPCKTVVVVPRLPNTEVAWLPPPKTSMLAVKAAALVTQVGQDRVAIVVMGA